MSLLNARTGSTVFSNILSCDGVITGAFLPQPDLQVPEKVMSEHAG
jgi:hypothetical protein